MSYEKKFDKPYQPMPDSGNLHASLTKVNEKSPDYFGEIAINLKDMTNIKMDNGNHIVKLSGWKKTDRNGKTYLSIKVNRYVPKGEAPQAQPQVEDEEDPF